MLTNEMGHCPDCNVTLNTRATVCCGVCADRRRQAMRERMSHSTEIGRTSSPESFEMNSTICGHGPIGQPPSREDKRGLPAMRDDVTWHIGKHGAG